MTLTALAQAQATAIDGKKYVGNNQLPDSNPYKLKLGNAAANPVLKDNIFAKEVQARVTAAPLNPMSAEQLFDILVAKATVNPQQTQALAQQFTDFFKEGSEGQWITSGAAQIGYPRPQSYRLAGVGEPDPKKGIEVLAPAEVVHALTKRIAADYQRRLRANSPLFGIPVEPGPENRDYTPLGTTAPN